MWQAAMVMQTQAVIPHNELCPTRLFLEDNGAEGLIDIKGGTIISAAALRTSD
jgi:hypothetical protein